MEWIAFWDHQILSQLIQHIRTDWLTPIMTCITSLGNVGAVWLVIALVCLMRPKSRRCGAAMITALLLGLVLGNGLLKHWVARPRPFLTHADLIPLIREGGFSFPSGHTLSSFTAATACFCYYKKAGAACYVLAFLIGFSRLYMAVHYPSDVLCGGLLGIAIGLAAVCLVNRTADAIRFARIKRK